MRPVVSVVVEPFASHALGFVGTVQPRYKVDLGFRILGRMISRSADVGDQIKAGGQVAAIDATALEFAVRSATADVTTARAQLGNAVGVEERQRLLAERNVASQAQLEAAQQARESAAAGLRRAEAGLSKAKDQLGYAQLRSDTDGVVTAVGAQAGQVVSPGQAVVTVARPDIREATIDLPEDVARTLAPGAAFDVALQLDPTIRTPGRVREISPQADQATRTRRVLVSLPEASAVFRLGTTVTAILAAPVTDGIDLPPSAVLEREGKILVWVVDPAGRVSTREVRLGRRTDTSLRIVDGLATGTRVVTAGVHSLQAGQRVSVSDEGRR